MRYLLIFILLLADFAHLNAEEKSDVLGEGDSNWPGIRYQITDIQRIPPDRLLVVVRILATAQASAAGTLIGFPVQIPPNANKYDVAAGYYHPRPLSLASSVMVDDLTQQKFLVLPPVAPHGKKYRPGDVLDSLRPGGRDVLTIQFAVPPPPPPPQAGQPPVKQTLSFLLTNAKELIRKIAIPPLEKPSL
jgi:hypothetical protein